MEPFQNPILPFCPFHIVSSSIFSQHRTTSYIRLILCKTDEQVFEKTLQKVCKETGKMGIKNSFIKSKNGFYFYAIDIEFTNRPHIAQIIHSFAKHNKYPIKLLDGTKLYLNGSLSDVPEYNASNVLNQLYLRLVRKKRDYEIDESKYHFWNRYSIPIYNDSFWDKGNPSMIKEMKSLANWIRFEMQFTICYQFVGSLSSIDKELKDAIKRLCSSDQTSNNQKLNQCHRFSVTVDHQLKNAESSFLKRIESYDFFETNNNASPVLAKNGIRLYKDSKLGQLVLISPLSINDSSMFFIVDHGNQKVFDRLQKVLVFYNPRVETKCDTSRIICDSLTSKQTKIEQQWIICTKYFKRQQFFITLSSKTKNNHPKTLIDIDFFCHHRNNRSLGSDVYCALKKFFKQRNMWHTSVTIDDDDEKKRCLILF